MKLKNEKLHTAGDKVIATYQAVYDAFVHCGIIGHGIGEEVMEKHKKTIKRSIKQKLELPIPDFPTPPLLNKAGRDAIKQAQRACNEFNQAVKSSD